MTSPSRKRTRNKKPTNIKAMYWLSYSSYKVGFGNVMYGHIAVMIENPSIEHFNEWLSENAVVDGNEIIINNMGIIKL